MPFDIHSLAGNGHGDVLGSKDIGAVTSVDNLGGGNYAVGTPTSHFGGSLFDFASGDPTADVATATLHPYINSTLDPLNNIITYQFTHVDGSTVPVFGGQVVGYNNNQLLVDQLSGFTPGISDGTPNPHHFEIFSTIDLSLTEAGYAGPPLPMFFGQTGPFAGFPVPEPSPLMLLPVMLIGFVVSRLPAVRRLCFGQTAA
jgi:hypothetical protein